MFTITRSKGGSEERQEEIGVHSVPDLWHLYLHLRQTAEAAGVIYDTEAAMGLKWSDEARPMQTIKVEMNLQGAALAALMVLDCWHLCHDLIRHIEDLQSS